MIYLDNGATSYPKPKGMTLAMEECILKYCGNPGRSGHLMSMKTGEEVYHARRKVAELFNIQHAERLIFTKNATEALNIGIHGVLKDGDHVITTSMEHNSVLRPLKSLENSGVTQSIIRADRQGCIKVSDIEKLISRKTKMIVVTAASNVTGTKMPIKEIGDLARKKGVIFMVDGSQGAGSMDLDIEKMKIDMLAFPGHKGLLGPLGTGALYVDNNVKITTLIQGGTGTESKSRMQPLEFPEGFEAGTVNAPGIIGLGYSAEFIKKISTDVISEYEETLMSILDESFGNMDFIKTYGPKASQRTGILLINVDNIPSEEVTTQLNNEYGIAVRGGYHCAGLAHKTIGTWDTGGVRISVGPFNTKSDMEKLTDAIWKIGSRQNARNKVNY